ncbi:cytochrome P450 [Aspergillus tetrazonus]
MLVFTIPLATALIYITHSAFSFLSNLRLVCKICPSLPRVLFPVSEVNLLYLALFESRWFNHIRRYWLPTSIADYIADAAFRGRWDVKDRLARKYGGVYLSVAPGLISCHVGDAEVVSQVVKERKGFVKPVKHLEAFEMYGRNVLTSEGSEWAYHHRYSAAAFNDKNNGLVWQESAIQAQEMMAYWERKFNNSDGSHRFTVPDVREDILKLSLNIICSAGFGVRLPYRPATSATAERDKDSAEDLFKDAATPAPEYHFTFRGVMEYMNRSMMSVFIANGLLPKWIPRMLVPFFKTDFAAHEDLKRYLHALIEVTEKSEHEKHNLLGRLVAARREEQSIRSSGSGPGLSNAEILGNTYIFSLAGHETTATTMRFALPLLAIHQDVQDRLYEELEEALRDQPADPAEWEYSTVFPRLVTPLCIMLETLRLYPPVVSIPKLTTTHMAEITYKGERHCLPPNVRVNLNTNALHYSEAYWGPDADSFDPRRWDKRNADSFLARNASAGGLSGPGLESRNVHKPVRGAFIPFSDGLRACIGRKFAQVEFIATLAVIFHRYRVTLVRVGQETEEDARKRVEKALRESSTLITLALGGVVPLAFVRRTGLAAEDDA